jgi:hypothetical protein
VKRYGKHYGKMPATGHGHPLFLKALMPKQIGKKEVKFFSSMEKRKAWCPR